MSSKSKDDAIRVIVNMAVVAILIDYMLSSSFHVSDDFDESKIYWIVKNKISKMLEDKLKEGKK